MNFEILGVCSFDDFKRFLKTIRYYSVTSAEVF